MLLVYTVPRRSASIARHLQTETMSVSADEHKEASIWKGKGEGNGSNRFLFRIEIHSESDAWIDTKRWMDKHELSLSSNVERESSARKTATLEAVASAASAAARRSAIPSSQTR